VAYHLRGLIRSNFWVINSFHFSVCNFSVCFLRASDGSERDGFKADVAPENTIQLGVAQEALDVASVTGVGVEERRQGE
jgi:hypothetical protein